MAHGSLIDPYPSSSRPPHRASRHARTTPDAMSAPWASVPGWCTSGHLLPPRLPQELGPAMFPQVRGELSQGAVRDVPRTVPT